MLIKLPNLKVIRRKRAKIELCKFAKIYRRFYHTNVCKILRLWWTISSLVFIKSLSNYSILLILRPLQKFNTVETPATSLQRPLSVLLSPRWPLWRGSTVVLSLTLNALHLCRLSSRHLPLGYFENMMNSIQLSLEGEVNSGGYIYSCSPTLRGIVLVFCKSVG